MVKENVESDGIEEAVNQRCKLQTPSISGRQKPQLDCDAVEGAHEYGEWPKSFCTHYNGTWQTVTGF